MTSSPDNPTGPDRRRCVGCGAAVRTLYVQYSPGNIRLMKCEKCKAVADPYIECEFMIILIDLILHKVEAYRHLLFNMLNLESNLSKDILLKSFFVYILLDAYRISFLQTGDSSNDLLLAIWTFAKILTGVILGNLIFMLLILTGVNFVLNISYDIKRYKEVILAIIISSYLKLFLFSMMVWDFPSSVLLIVDIFVLSSNTVALRVITQLGLGNCFSVCFLARLAKIICDYFMLQLL
ncbi:hypothetical protein LUZ60_010340 [Juncus effusus]|nr:hypothetical protein LUZ60_010340 [Juncus effusus]